MNIEQKGIKSLRVFGSDARGDSDQLSDHDVLVVTDRDVRLSEGELEQLNQELGFQCSFALYSMDRIRQMHSYGHLFSWHLFLESKKISNNRDFIDELGRPSDYTSAKDDIIELYNLLRSVSHSLQRSPFNVVYEAGLLYVTSRNIAMSASWFSPNGLDFSRYSPLRLFVDTLSPFPLCELEYNQLISARNASTRGLECPELACHEVYLTWSKIHEWAENVLRYIGV